MKCVVCRSDGILGASTASGDVCARCLAHAERAPGNQIVIKKTIWRSFQLADEPQKLSAEDLKQARDFLYDTLKRIVAEIEGRRFACNDCCDTRIGVCQGCVGLTADQSASCARCSGSRRVECFCYAEQSADVQRETKGGKAEAKEALGPVLLESEMATDPKDGSEA